MKYILMMNCPKSGYDQFGAWPKQDIQAHIAFMIGFSKSLAESGEFVAGEGLADPKQAKVVRAGKDGAGLQAIEPSDRMAEMGGIGIAHVLRQVGKVKVLVDKMQQVARPFPGAEFAERHPDLVRLLTPISFAAIVIGALALRVWGIEFARGLRACLPSRFSNLSRMACLSCGVTPTEPTPCTLLWPRIGIRPAPGLPIMPRSSARLAIICTFCTPCR